MKKIILLLTALIALACSNDETETVAVNQNTFNPPAWIQGTWAKENAAAADYNFVINADNICSTAANTNSACWKEGIAELKKKNANYVISEEATDTFYSVSYTVNGKVTSVMFTKMDDNKIDVFVPEGADPKGAGEYL
ncbi:hypothetical protein R1T16_14010 [Flavobacterium sp. DG1-102-2]|uniref:hypothetical protein n=1 Tax=Flavobacterium sp. DG1-102-2 TaxID=3081663 RepID=UPI00294A60B8|nr:hypothetical protein [Flavobacterium sp. DG1-102-2]MDV6169546.1 hypothetical protein [Flavobacterium sp. DG1-102-2]